VADTLSRRAREGSDAAKPVRKLFPHVHIFLRIEPLSLVVGKGQEDLNQLHVSPRGPWCGTWTQSHVICDTILQLKPHGWTFLGHGDRSPNGHAHFACRSEPYREGPEFKVVCNFQELTSLVRLETTIRMCARFARLGRKHRTNLLEAQ
jgi:hypothetical protein